jgi:hypothetical protein
MNVREIVWGGMDWIDLAPDKRDVPCEYGDDPSGFADFGKFFSS